MISAVPQPSAVATDDMGAPHMLLRALRSDDRLKTAAVVARDVDNNSCSHAESLNCFGRFGNRPNEFRPLASRSRRRGRRLVRPTDVTESRNLDPWIAQIETRHKAEHVDFHALDPAELDASTPHRLASMPVPLSGQAR